jgi:hypothetical protein
VGVVVAPVVALPKVATVLAAATAALSVSVTAARSDRVAKAAPPVSVSATRWDRVAMAAPPVQATVAIVDRVAK